MTESTVLDRAAPSGPVDVDAPWAAVLAHRGPLLRVLGGPGTGKSTLAVEIVATRVGSGEVAAQECLLLGASRRAAGALRDAVTTRLAATTREPLARTFASLGFGILRRAAVLADLPTPRLLSGPEQDVILRELLEGHRLEPATAPTWPAELGEALSTRGFRAELRDLLMRAVERGVDPERLEALGRDLGRPEWIAAAAVLREYDEVTALARPGAFDPAWIVTGAADALEDVPGLLDDLVREVRLVVVDDAQEVTASGARLLGILAESGVRIVLLGDPDCTVQAFRGADPGFLGQGWRGLLSGGETVRLERGHRLPTVLADFVGRVPPLIGAVAGVRHRAATPTRADGVAEVHQFRSAAAEAGFVADVLRRAHLLDGLPWSQAAVVVRGQARAATIRRVLASAQVPVAPSDGSAPVRDEEAVRPLLTLLRLGLARRAARGRAEADDLDMDPDGGWVMAPEIAVDLLTSPYGGADAVTVRRLRRALRRAAADEASGGAEVGVGDALLARALAQPGRLAEIGDEGDGARRIGAMLAAATRRLVAEPRVSAEEVLWDVWVAAGVAEPWRAAALAGGRSGARADRDLDAVVELFAAAAALADRLPGSDTEAFLDRLGAEEVAADSLAARSPDDQCVQVLTPHAAAGREWRLVVVAGVQEGGWPDLRLRGSLLGSEHLVDAIAGRDRTIPAAQAAIRHDEARLLHVAVSRARDRLVVTAVRSEDEQPSPYLDVLDPRPSGAARPFTEVERPLTLVGTVGALRRAVVATGSGEAARTLALLAGERVRGADPATWWALREPTSREPRIAGGDPVTVSPSGLVEFGHCQTRWLLGRLGGEGPPVGSAALGTLVHEVLAECGDAAAPALGARLDQEWTRLGLGPGWAARAKRGEAAAMLDQAAAYFAMARRDGWVRVGAEVSLRHTLGRAVIAGVIDRLEADGSGRVRVIDFKTGSSKPKVAEVARHPQLGSYQAALEAGAFGTGVASAGAALVQLGKASTKDIARSVQAQAPLTEDEDPGWAAAMVEAAAEAMAGATYSATPGEWCRTCAVRSSCPVLPEGAMFG